MKPYHSFAAILLLAGCMPPLATGASTRDGQTLQLIVASTTDVHGRIRGWDYFANRQDTTKGLSRSATIIDSVRAANPGRVIVVDAGDFLQGTPYTYLAARQPQPGPNPVIAAMNAVGYDAVAIGNHEFNYGIPYLDKAVADARFPVLSANIFRVGDGHAYKPWTIVERQGVKIGIVGATTPGVVLWDRDKVRGRDTLTDIVPAVRQAVAEARAAGADVVIAAAHTGYNEKSSYDTVGTGVASEAEAKRMAEEIPGLDLVVYGHSHVEDAGRAVGNSFVVQPKFYAQSVGITRLDLVRGNGRWQVTAVSGTALPTHGRKESARILAASEVHHRRTVEFSSSAIGTTPVAWKGDSARLMDTPLIDFILEVERKASGAQLASSAAFSVSGGSESSTLTGVAIPAGPVTIAQLSKLYPYENYLRAIKISGKQLRDYLEYSARYFLQAPAGSTTPLQFDRSIPGYNFDIVSGVDYTIDVSRPIGSRITTLTYGGKPVAPTDSFTLALSDYRQSGGGGYAMIAGAPVVYDPKVQVRDLLVDEVRAKGVIRPEDYFHQNWKIVRGGTTSGQNFDPNAVRLRVIATNDFHGALEPRPDAQGVSRGGAAYVARAIENARSGCMSPCESILVDGGDLFQGTPASNLAYGKPVVDYYNSIGYVASALGNHEFDWGQDTLRARMHDAKFPFLGANVRYTDGRDVPWIPNDTIVTRGPWKIGIIGGASIVTPITAKAKYVAGLRFDPEAPIFDSITRSLRARGANAVIVVVHDGAFCGRDGSGSCRGEIINTAQAMTEKVDVIVSAHTHTLVNTVVNGIPIVQARSSGRAVATIDIVMGADGHNQVSTAVTDIAVDSMKPVASIDTIVQAAVAKVAPLVNRRVATLATNLDKVGSQYPLGNLIADAERWATKVDIAIVNNGGIRAPLRAGTLTYGSLFEVQPFGNTMWVMKLRGSQLKPYLEGLLKGDNPDAHVSGITIGYDPEQPAGDRIVSLRFPEGRTLSDAALYTIAMNDYMLTAPPFNPPDKSVPTYSANVADLDALINYLKSLRQPVRAPTEVRIFQTQK